MANVRDDFEALAARAVRHVELGPGGVQDIEMILDTPLFSSHARFVVSDGLTFMLGANSSATDVVLRGHHPGPLIAIHANLRGSATLALEGLSAPIGGAVGGLTLYATPSGRSTVNLQADTANQAFRVVFTAAKLQTLATRYDAVAPLAASVTGGEPFYRSHTRPFDPMPWISEVMESAHLGPARPMFLEARALDWLATLLARQRLQPVDRLPRREVDRIYEARAILLSRSTHPPTLTQLAADVGTNETTLKRNFKLVLGKPPYAFLLAHRLDVARRMLAETDQSVKEIAAAIGYAHACHFSTAFRRQLGVTPWQHRDAIRRGRS